MILGYVEYIIVCLKEENIKVESWIRIQDIEKENSERNLDII